MPSCACSNNGPFQCCECFCPCIRPPTHTRSKQKIGPTANRTDKNYFIHRERLKRMTKAVDNDPSKIYLELMTRTSLRVLSQLRLMEIVEQNKMMMTRINRIMRSKGRIDTYNPTAGIRRSQLIAYYQWLVKVEEQNVALSFRIQSVTPVIDNKANERDWKKFLGDLAASSKYPLILPGLRSTAMDFSDDCMDQFRPKVYVEIGVKGGRKLGKLTILLYPDHVPLMVKNFLQLILNGQPGGASDKKRSKRKLRFMDEPSTAVKKCNYIESPIHRIFKQLYAEAGDNTLGNGLGGCSAFGKDFREAIYTVEPRYTGMVGMVPDEDGLINSKFMFTFKPLPVLKGKFPFFGRIIAGLTVLEALECGGRDNAVPREHLIITSCGLVSKGKSMEDACRCRRCRKG